MCDAALTRYATCYGRTAEQNHPHMCTLLFYLFSNLIRKEFIHKQTLLSQFKVPSLLFEFQSVYINNKTIIRELAILAARKSIRLLRLAFAHNYALKKFAAAFCAMVGLSLGLGLSPASLVQKVRLYEELVGPLTFLACSCRRAH